MAEERRNRTSAVEFDGALQSDDGGGIALDHGDVELLEGLVVVGDVGLVVLLVVELHDLAADDGLQGAVVVRKVREGDGHQPSRLAEP